MTKNKIAIFVLSIATVFGLNLVSSAQTATSTGVKESKTETLLKEIKVTYKKFQEGGMIVTYQGKEKPEINLILAEAGPAVAIVSDAAEGKEITLTPEKMRKLLEFNSRSDYIKAGISDDGSIRVQTEQNLTLMSPAFFHEILDQVAAGTDEVAKIIGPIKKAPAPKN